MATVRVREVRGVPSDGMGLKRQVRVVDVEEKDITPQMSHVTEDTPLSDWEDEA